MSLSLVINKRYDQTYTIQWIGKQPDIISNTQPHNILTYETSPIMGITSISNANVIADGETNLQYLKKIFRYKNGTNDWSEEQNLELLPALSIDPCVPFILQIILYFVYDSNPITNPPKNIYINNISVNGTFEYLEIDAEAVLNPTFNEIILTPKDIYKVFSLSDFLVNLQINGNASINIKYRFTQDNGFSYTPWEPLTADNLKTLRLNELRFATPQYLLTFEGNEGSAVVHDIILFGSFQNISANYLKTNRFGLKQDCICYIKSKIDPNINSSMSSISCNGLSCYEPSVVDQLNTYNSENSSGLWNPYDTMQKIVEFSDMLANQINKYGWKAIYIKVDPDGNGYDVNLFEYSIKNAKRDPQEVKVIVPNNEFKDEVALINSVAGLDLMETFEVNITKTEFKNAFGIEERPGRDDIVYLCVTNKLYYVKHAQAKKEIMNASIYYRVILEKYEQRADIRIKNNNVKSLLDSLTKDTTIEEVIGIEQKKDQAKSTNLDQTYPTSQDKTRQIINKLVYINKAKIQNNNIDVVTSYYQFIKLAGNVAVTYTKADQNLEPGYNRSFMGWFKIGSQYSPDKALTKAIFNSYEIPKNTTYNLLTNYDSTNKLGYQYNIEKDLFSFKINEIYYNMKISMMTDVWYQYVINLDQRQRKVKINLYKRTTDVMITFFNPNTYEKIVLYTPDELVDAYDLDNPEYTYSNAISDGYQPVQNVESDITTGSNNDYLLISSQEFNIDDPFTFNIEEDIKILGSNNFYCTNLRIFNDVIADDQQSSILNQNIITNAQYILLADNANRQILTTNFWNTNFK